MAYDWIIHLCMLLGLLSALVAGVFQSFSDFVMRGLGRSQPRVGIDAMKQINRTVLRSYFLTTFLLLAPVSLGFAVFAWMNLDGMTAGLIIAAGFTYCLSVFLVTIFGNVPMNRRLDSMQNQSADAADYWGVYQRVWTGLNHVRTFGAIATAILYLLASVAMR